jgi:hypothetical protein
VTGRVWGPTTAFIMVVAFAGCSSKPVANAPQPVTAYESALAMADERVALGDYSGADRILADFALRAKGTDDGIEVAFWRALYMVDPSNRTSSTADGIRALDIYLNTDGSRRYRAQARVVKRIAQTILSLRSEQQGPPRVIGRDTVFVTREAEIAALRDELARANAELERIRKRLANPKR